MNYDNTLQEGEDVVEAASQRPLIAFRDGEIETALRALARKRSVLLVGPPGVGKSTVIDGVAQHLDDETGLHIRRVSTTQILSGTRYIGDWQTKLTQLLREAGQSNTILNIVDVWNLPTVGQTAQSKNNMLDAIRPWLANGNLRLLSEVTDERLHELMHFQNFVTFFEVVRVEPLSAQQQRAIIDLEARRLELPLPHDTRERLIQLSESFSVASSGPGPALDLVQKLHDYRDQKLAAGEPAEMTPLFAEKVFATHSGLPVFVVSRTETKSAADIRDWFRGRIIGQEAAIDAVVEMIAFYKARLHDKDKPVGSFLLVGPTGVGKTELARCLAEFFFGSERRLLRFDMSEFADYHSFERLIGSLNGSPTRPARLIDPVRLQPFQVLLFDELEKAHPNILDLFLQLLDEGRLTTPQGETVSFRNTIVIATSNAGAIEGMTSRIGFGDQGDGYDRERALRAIESQFRPEFINRFQHVVLFHPLTRDQATRIARADLKTIMQREGIAAQNLIVEIHDDVIDHVLTVGFNPRYGARGIKRELRRQVILPIATLLMEHALDPGTLIDVRLVENRVRVRAMDSAEDIGAQIEKAPARIQSGERVTIEEVRARIASAKAACVAIAEVLALPQLRDEVDRIDTMRVDRAFWETPDAAGRILAQQTRSLESIKRIEQIQDSVANLARAFEQGATRSDLVAIANMLLRVEAALAIANRELVAMSPDGYWDALVEIAPIGPDCEARDFMFGIYREWARERRLRLEMLREPLASDEPIALLLKGPFAYGYLALEAGHHRLRRRGQSSVARVTLGPLMNLAAPVDFSEQRPLKATGQLGGRVRSRVRITDSRLTLQNERNLNQNRELAREIAPSWRTQPTAAATPRVRRYDIDPFHVRDYLTGSEFSRRDVLSAKPFHALLCRRIDCTAEKAGAE